MEFTPFIPTLLELLHLRYLNKLNSDLINFSIDVKKYCNTESITYNSIVEH